jgi:hypothetical protein
VVNYAPFQPMNNERLGALLAEIVPELEGGPGMWKGVAQGVQILVITDESHDRMRVIAPICPANEVAEAELWAMLKANFVTALDARYCVHEDTVFAAFIHPLGALSAKELRSAVQQVTNLALTYGGAYSPLRGLSLEAGDPPP